MTASPSISPWIGTPDGNEATVFVELKCAEGMAGPPSFLRTTSPMRGNTQSLPLATLLTPIAIGCGDLQPSQIAAPDSGVRDAKIFFDTGSEPANQSHFKRQKRRPAGYGSSAYGGVSKAWLQIPKIEPVLVTVEVRRLLLDLPPCNNVSPVGPWWVQFGPQLGDAFRSCPENACPAGSWILRKVVRTASPLSVVLLQTRFRRH